ncbi:MAG TPA: dienelactone hydrolase family protein [Solirubrobacteraceae bacterium]|jgi:carboxymethylenebutenolidase|nr:dienelactone hydrolase family protein [Solirubrobacteraceae bacterium]
MSGETVDITTGDGVADAYLSLPPGQHGSRSGVLFLMDAFGLRPRIEQMVDRIAARGFVVLAPNVLYRAGRAQNAEIPDLADPAQRDPFFARLRPAMAELTPERIASDGAAYLDYLGEHASAPFAITGYCLGGRVGWRIAAAYPERVAALAAFHAGGLVSDDEDSAHLSAGEISAELYFGHADNDQSMSPEHVAALERALEDAGSRYRSELYQGAAHGYTMSDTAAYDEAAAERHFTELFALLDRTIVG